MFLQYYPSFHTTTNVKNPILDRLRDPTMSSGKETT